VTSIQHPASSIKESVPAVSARSARSAACGFTLLEVLIATAVLVIGIAAILPLFAVGTTSHKRAMDQSNVSWIAPRIAGKIQESLYDVNPRDVKGAAWQEGAATYTYDADFEPLGGFGQADPTANSAFLLKLTLRWGVPPDEFAETYSTVVLRKLLR
jgi:prepilin-type N-terminal cleavage/methylation domain-containing protein